MAAIGQILEKIQSEIAKEESEKEHLEQERAQAQSHADQVHADVDRQEQIVASEGGSFARKREDVKREKLQLDHEILKTQTELRSSVPGYSPSQLLQNIVHT